MYINLTMEPREKALNQIINYDNGYGVHQIDPSQLKVDFFKGYWRYYLELGIAFLEGRIEKKFIPCQMYGRLSKFQELKSKRLFKTEENYAEVEGIPGDGYSTSLHFSDGTHRTIVTLSSQRKENRYFDKVELILTKDLIEWAEEKFQNKLMKDEKEVIYVLKKGILVNENPVEMPPFPSFEAEEND